jgi:thymidylate synthase
VTEHWPPVYDTADQMFRAALYLCLRSGARAAPRGKPVLEVAYPVTLQLFDVSRPFVANRVRGCRYRFGLTEAAWILSGSNDAQLIGKYNSKMLEFSDDGRTLWGAYGPRLMGQLPHVVETLRRDPDSRQAVVTTWRPHVGVVGDFKVEDLARAGVMGGEGQPMAPAWDGYSWRSKDVPCTVAWHFMLREGLLDLTVFMRSNDAWLGLPYDTLSFTTVQRVVASMIGAAPGTYTLVASNLHLYQEHWAQAAAALSESPGYDIPRVEPFGDCFAAPTLDSRGKVERVRRWFSDVFDGGDVGGPMGVFHAAVENSTGKCTLYDRLRLIHKK